MDRLASLTSFARIVETGGFSAAARRLSLSVTMVSNHVRELERHLGVRLLNRTTRKVSLTEIGQEYYRRAVRILTDLEEADLMAGALQATPRGTLHIYASVHIVRYLAPIVSEYLSLYPAMSIDLSIGEKMVDLAEEGFDLAMRTVAPPDTSMIVRRLTPWRGTVVCSPGYLASHPVPRQPADLAGHNCLRYAFYPFGDEWRFEDRAGRPVAVKVAGNVVTNSGELLRHMTLDGHGFSLAPPFLVADDIRAGRLITALPDYRAVEFALHAVYQDRHYLSGKVRAFIDLAVQHFGDGLQWQDAPVE